MKFDYNEVGVEDTIETRITDLHRWIVKLENEMTVTRNMVEQIKSDRLRFNFEIDDRLKRIESFIHRLDYL